MEKADHPAPYQPRITPMQGAPASLFEFCNKLPTLTRDEEKELASRIQQGDPEAREKMVLHNMRLVIKMARQRYKYYSNVDLWDMVSAGVIGLIDAAESFDPIEHDVPFAHFASYRIISAFKQEYKNSVLMRKKNTYVLTNYDYKYLDLYVNREAPDILIAAEENDIVAKALSILTERERDVIQRRLGLNGHAPETRPSIGKTHGITTQRVGQIEEFAWKKMLRFARKYSRPPTPE